jgi:hypothetical protein
MHLRVTPARARARNLTIATTSYRAGWVDPRHMPDQSGRLRRTHSEPHAGRKAQGPARAPPVTRTSSRVKALARVARPIWQHGTAVSPIPPMATAAPSSRWEDPKVRKPRAGTENLWIRLIQYGGDAGPVPPHGTGPAPRPSRPICHPSRTRVAVLLRQSVPALAAGPAHLPPQRRMRMIASARR